MVLTLAMQNLLADFAKRWVGNQFLAMFAIANSFAIAQCERTKKCGLTHF